MTGLLETELSDIGPRLVGFWRWWTRELQAVAALPALRRRSQTRLVVVEVAHGALHRKTSAGLVGLEEAPSGRGPVALRLSEDMVLRRTVTTPRLSRADTERMVQLDGDRLTPFARDAAYHHVDLLPGPVGPTREVELVSVSRQAADDALAAALGQGLQVQAVWAWGDPPNVVDILPQMRLAQASRPDRRIQLLWAAALGLVALNVGVWIWRDVQDTHALEAQAGSERHVALHAADVVRRANALRAYVDAAVVDRRDNEPLHLMDTVAQALPAGVVLQRLDIRSASVRAAGSKDAALDLAATLRKNPVIGGVRTSAPASTLTSPDTFDLEISLSGLRQERAP